MSAREWKPGDVAVDGAGNRLMCAERADGSLVWMNVFGGFYPIDGLIEDARPLAVVDPGVEGDTDRVVDRLDDDLLWALEYDHDKSYLERYAALREFANPKPPKPEEPTGLGAVVDDGDDVWVRVDLDEAGWYPSDRSGSTRCWADFPAAVRVLSEGVRP